MALQWTPAAEAGRGEAPAREAQPWGPAGPRPGFPAPAPVWPMDRPTSTQGCLEVTEKPPGTPTNPIHPHLQPQLHPRRTHSTPSLAEGKPGMREGKPPSLPGVSDPSAPSPSSLENPHPLIGEARRMWGSAGRTCSPWLCLHPLHGRLPLPAFSSPERSGSLPSGCGCAHRREGSGFEFLNKKLKLVSERH